MTRILWIFVALLIIAQTPVHAYTDPGSGTLIWQILLAASFGVMFYLRKMISWVRGLKAGKEEPKAAINPAAQSRDTADRI